MKQLIRLVMDLTREMHELRAFIEFEGKKYSERISDEWMDSQRVMNVLKISKRTMQNLRDEGTLPFSHVNGKFYYRAADLDALLKSNYLKK